MKYAPPAIPKPRVNAKTKISAVSTYLEELSKEDHSEEKVELLEQKKWMLSNGSLVVMQGETQKYWKHEIPRLVVLCRIHRKNPDLMLFASVIPSGNPRSKTEESASLFDNWSECLREVRQVLSTSYSLSESAVCGTLRFQNLQVVTCLVLRRQLNPSDLPEKRLLSSESDTINTVTPLTTRRHWWHVYLRPWGFKSACRLTSTPRSQYLVTIVHCQIFCGNLFERIMILLTQSGKRSDATGTGTLFTKSPKNCFAPINPKSIPKSKTPIYF